MAEEFICDPRELRSFIGKLKEIAAGETTSAEARIAAIRPLFRRLTGQSRTNLLPASSSNRPEKHEHISDRYKRGKSLSLTPWR